GDPLFFQMSSCGLLLLAGFIGFVIDRIRRLFTLFPRGIRRIPGIFSSRRIGVFQVLGGFLGGIGGLFSLFADGVRLFFLFVRFLLKGVFAEIFLLRVTGGKKESCGGGADHLDDSCGFHG